MIVEVAAYCSGQFVAPSSSWIMLLAAYHRVAMLQARREHTMVEGVGVAVARAFGDHQADESAERLLGRSYSIKGLKGQAMIENLASRANRSDDGVPNG